MDIDQQDTGYSASVTGTAFLPLGQSETGMMLLFQKPSTSSDAMKSLVKLGAKAVPVLVKHLADKRPTKIVLPDQDGFGTMIVDKDDKKGAKKARFAHGAKRYTLTVADLCYVALGQIVNRNYSAVRYVPSGMTFVVSVAHSTGLREGVTKEWGSLTPEKHRESLAHDLLESDNEDDSYGASLRLAYYYPEALEALALKQLAKPTYSLYNVDELIRTRLYLATNAKERTALVDEFVRQHGAVARDGIRWALFHDLDIQEADEEGRLFPKGSLPYRARECLIDVFGLPPEVKSKDRPAREPLSQAAQTRFVQTLHYDPSPALDKALRGILAKTDDDNMAKGCLDRLVGRGYDADIEAYLKRRLPRLKGDDRKELQEYESKLGWSRLHAAVYLDVPEFVEAALRQKVAVDARGRDGRTALHLATDDGKDVVAAALLKANANPNVKDGQGRIPVQLAAQGDHAAIVRLLVRNKSDIPDVFTAAIVGAKDRLAQLVQATPGSTKLRNVDGLTPLHVAAREGHADAVRLLIAAGADVKAVDNHPETQFRQQFSHGLTPLHLAAMADKPAIALILLDHGADVNAPDQEARLTPLHLAAWAGEAELVKLLLARKADREAKDEMGRTPLMLAKDRGHAAVITLLEK
jgi:ankyrin repeat protein